MEIIKEKAVFEKIINKNKPIMIDFFAAWCPPCKALAPILETVESENANSAEFYKIDVDTEDLIDIVNKYKITSVPTIIVFKNGEVYKEKTGLTDKKTLLSMLI